MSDLAVASFWAFGTAFAFRFGLLPTSVDDALSLSRPLEQQVFLGVLASVGAFLILKTILRFTLGLFYETNPLSTTFQLLSTFSSQEKRRNIKVDNRIEEYNNLHKADLAQRESAYQKLVDAYYELATQFYEWGWGQSFHFANRMKDEKFFDSIKRHEHYLGGRLNVSAGGKLLDCGCGIGGPYRNISRFTGCDVTGITINEYQVQRGNEINRQRGLDSTCRSMQGDFMKLPFKDNEFDGVYAIEATCHAPTREGVYSQIMRVLKPGGHFVCYEWCLTDKYDPTNEHHRKIKKMIEEGDGLPDMATCAEVTKSAKSVGFEVIETRDMVDDPHTHITWFQPLSPSWNPLSQRFQFNPIGVPLMRVLLRVMEFFWLAPKGTAKVQEMLQQAAIGLRIGGEIGIFTPMFLIVARKPFAPTKGK